jgi:hypothetical protein
LGIELAEVNMTKGQRTWSRRSPKLVKPVIPEDVKADVDKKAQELVETVLKPAHIKPPLKGHQFNYIVDIYTKWYRNYLYFRAKYAVPGPTAISPSFEAKFARLEYVGHNRFNLSFMRHTEQWEEIGEGLSLSQCLAAVKDDPLFYP